MQRAIVAGIVWGILEVPILLVPLYFLGAAPPFSSLMQVLEYGLLVIPISFFSAYIVADLRDWVKALIMAETLSFALAALTLEMFPPSMSFPRSLIPAYLGFLAVPFFLFGVAGGTFGSFLGSWIAEEGRTYTLSFTRHRVLFLLMALMTIVIVSIFAVNSLIAFDVDNAVKGLTLKGPLIVASQSVYMGSNTQMIWSNFTSVTKGGGEMVIGWSSSNSISFHVWLSSYEESTITSQPGCSCPGTYGGYGVVQFQTPPSETYVSASNSYVYYFPAWFHDDACSASSCPSGWVNYTISMYYY